ncbi:MAG: quinone-dependent dihydroorotate dehydrogenase [Roseiflexaceae bacterium]|nr:quinone-dependent dihydroorotate dehydrogenase [Roseiflexaceae bacterium]
MLLYHLIRPLLFRLDAERAHDAVTAMLRVANRAPLLPRLIGALYAWDDPMLAVEWAGLRFANPLGVAAGFDKRADLVDALALLGFSHVEVGTVTPRPQPGNPRPRLFRLPEDLALINRLGFNSPGMVAVAQALRARRSRNVILGVNIGKNRDTPLERAVEDYAATFVALAPLADYVAVNISSPNTPGLRRLHERAALEELLRELMRLNRNLPHPRPIALKVSPDETPEQIEEVVQAGCEAGVAAFIAANTTLAREGLRSPLANETGGLSGRPLAPRARQVIRTIYRLTRGTPPVIGVGGILTAEDAYLHIRAGARLVQLYTGMVYAGPAIARDIKRGLVHLLHRDGFARVTEATGVDAESIATPSV